MLTKVKSIKDNELDKFHFCGMSTLAAQSAEMNSAKQQQQQ